VTIDVTRCVQDSVSESRLAEIDAIAAALSAVFRRAAGVTILPYLHAEHAPRLDREVAAPLREAICGALGQIARLDELLDGPRGDAAWNGAITEAPADAAPRLGELLRDELWQQVGDVCFAARGELRRAERTIQHGDRAAPSHEDRLAACEGAHRKLRRALGAVLAALGRARDCSFPVLAALDAEAEAAAAVRRMYAKFRRSLPPCNTDEPTSVRRALRYAAVSIAVMVGGNEFGDVRTPDRALLLELQGRILRWARRGGADGDGAQLYRDIVTAADLLRAINLRQELATHDQRMLRDAAAALAAGDPGAALAAAAPALRALDGRDDALDALAQRALHEPPSRALVAALRAALDPTTTAAAPPESP
jgi:hypothetical protein